MSLEKPLPAAWQAQSERMAEAEASKQQSEPIYGGGGGNPPMEPRVPIKDYIDARDDAVESRLSTQLSSLATSKELRNNIWGAAGVGLGIILTLLAFGGDRFDGGMSTSAAVSSIRNEQAQVDSAQDAKLTDMDKKLDILIDRSSRTPEAPPT